MVAGQRTTESTLRFTRSVMFLPQGGPGMANLVLSSDGTPSGFEEEV